MIINTGQRTDIPAFYPKWLANRFKEGEVCVRNPFNEERVSRYKLSPDTVDVVGFCSKNPAPFFEYMDVIKDYGQYCFVTITPYGRDIEPGFPTSIRYWRTLRRSRRWLELTVSDGDMIRYW